MTRAQTHPHEAHEGRAAEIAHEGRPAEIAHEGRQSSQGRQGEPSYAEVLAYERRAHAASIRAIPAAELPDTEARAELVRLALTGHDVYAYRPIGSRTHVIWARQRSAWVEARFIPTTWACAWHAGTLQHAPATPAEE